LLTRKSNSSGRWSALNTDPINQEREFTMDPTEIHAKATIAAALIASHSVEIPRIPSSGSDWTKDVAAVRLHDLTDFVYRTIVGEESGSLDHLKRQ
jgi:hypothetical protein